MSRLGKQIIVFSMVWVLLFMAVSQIVDNVTGKGMPARQQPAGAEATTAGPDEANRNLAQLQSCVAANPQNLECAVDLANLYFAGAQWEQAQVYYERAATLDPRNETTLRKLAGTYIYQSKFPQAIPTLQQAASLNPNSPEIRLLLGLALSRLDPPQTSAAAAEWRKVVEMAPGSDWAKQAEQYIAESAK